MHNLSSWKTDQHSIDYQQQLNFIESIVDGLQYLHNLGYAHGKLKDSNVLVGN